MVGANVVRPLLRRRRAESDRGPDREPHSRFPLAARQGCDRGDQPPAGGAWRRRRGPLGDAARGQAGGIGQPARACSSGWPTRPCALRPRLDMSASSRGKRPMSITSPASKSSSRPIPSRNRASERWKTSARRCDAPPRRGQPLQGTNAIGLAGATSAVNDLKRVTTSDQRRMYVLVTLGVYAILVALLRRPGISLYLIATVVLGLPGLTGTDRLVVSRPAPWSRALGGPRLDRGLLSVRDPGGGGRGLQHPAHGPRDRGRAKATASPRERAGPSPIPAASSARAA